MVASVFSPCPFCICLRFVFTLACALKTRGSKYKRSTSSVFVLRIFSIFFDIYAYSVASQITVTSNNGIVQEPREHQSSSRLRLLA